MTKDGKSARNRRYYLKHREEVKQKNTDYARAHAEKVLGYKRKHYAANREEILAKQRAKYQTDEYRDARNAKYRATHTQPVSEHGEKMRRYFEQNDREKRAAKRAIKDAEERAKNEEIIARKINPKSSMKIAVIKREIKITGADIRALNEDYGWNEPLHA